jgi:hypothetical protein
LLKGESLSAAGGHGQSAHRSGILIGEKYWEILAGLPIADTKLNVGAQNGTCRSWSLLSSSLVFNQIETCLGGLGFAEGTLSIHIFSNQF